MLIKNTIFNTEIMHKEETSDAVLFKVSLMTLASPPAFTFIFGEVDGSPPSDNDNHI